MDIKEFANKYIQAEDEAWQNGNFNALEALEDPNVVYHMKYIGRDLVGWEAVKQEILNSVESATDRHREWGYVVGDGSVFVLTHKLSGKAENAMPAMSVTAGATLILDALFVFKVENEKVVEAWIHGNITLN